MAAPRNTILGHTIGVLTGYAIYKLTTLIFHYNTSMVVQFLSAGFGLGLSGMIMVVTKILHPPAASSCLIAALGLIENPAQIFTMMIAITLLCAQGYVMNKMAGIKYPLWNPFEETSLPKIKTLLGDLTELEKEDHIERIAAKLAMRQKIKDKN